MMEKTRVFTVPNLISLLRIPLAFLFLQSNPFYRILAILLSFLSDCLDGFVARQFKQVGRMGTLLDPLTDKFFVFFALFILIGENRLSFTEALILLSRDFSVILYGIYLAWRGRLFHYQFRAIWCGKITTFLQFLALLSLILHYSLPSSLYWVFILLGVLALGELYKTDQRQQQVLKTSPYAK